jgi:hypothetical protein
MLQDFYRSQDLFRTNVTIALWAVVELQFALIAATIPTLKAFSEKALIRLGKFFYDERSETVVRHKLVEFGLLGEDECGEKGILDTIEIKGSILASSRERKAKDESKETPRQRSNEKQIEEMLSKLVA